MYKGKRVLAIIPARAGSKGLPGKNILSFHGRPLIGWSILQARRAKYLDKIIVSTDDAKIAAISHKHGACVPFLRPARLALSHSNMIHVVLHALDVMAKKGETYEVVVLLQPTSPLRTSEDIDKTLELMFKKKADSLVSVTLCEHHPWWSVSLGKDFKIKEFLGLGKAHQNRQDLPVFYQLNGALFIAKEDFFRKEKTFIGKNTFAYIMPQEKSVDIDSRFDFKLAEFLMKDRS